MFETFVLRRDKPDDEDDPSWITVWIDRHVLRPDTAMYTGILYTSWSPSVATIHRITMDLTHGPVSSKFLLNVYTSLSHHTHIAKVRQAQILYRRYPGAYIALPIPTLHPYYLQIPSNISVPRSSAFLR